MLSINIHEAKTQLSKLINSVAKGESFIIAKAGVPIAQVIPYTAKNKKKRVPGSALGLLTISDDFNEPMDDDFIEYFK